MSTQTMLVCLATILLVWNVDNCEGNYTIITISETKFNDNNQHLHNISRPAYNFVGLNSRMNAGELVFKNKT